MLVIFQCIESVTDILNLSPTDLVSNIRHQHQCNQKSEFDIFGINLRQQLLVTNVIFTDLIFQL